MTTSSRKRNRALDALNGFGRLERDVLGCWAESRPDQTLQAALFVGMGLRDEPLLMCEMHIRLIFDPRKVEALIVIKTAKTVALTAPVRVDHGHNPVGQALLLDVPTQTCGRIFRQRLGSRHEDDLQAIL